jgi:hypothetical protein
LDISFIQALEQFGLTRVTVIDGEPFIPESDLEQLERVTRLHSELGINLEGIDAIRHLLLRVAAMQEELRRLRNRLRIYEDEG